MSTWAASVDMSLGVGNAKTFERGMATGNSIPRFAFTSGYSQKKFHGPGDAGAAPVKPDGFGALFHPHGRTALSQR